MRMPVDNLGRKLREAALWMRDVRSYDSHARRTRRQGPAGVQIQTIDRCNAACIMCPYSAFNKAGPANVMDDGLYGKILDELRQAGTVNSVALMLQNEPLLDRKFADRVRLARKALGRSVRIGTITNGSPLTTEMIDELVASEMDYVAVSIDAFGEDTFGRIRRGLDFGRVVGNTLSLIQRLGPRRVSVKFLRQRGNEAEEDAFANYWGRHGVRVARVELTNRAGWLDSYASVKKRRPDRWKSLAYPALNKYIPACPLPFSSMSILWDGRVVLCGDDWGPRDTVGDLSKQTLKEVWNGEKINHYRQLLWTHRAGESLVCAGCSQSDRFWRF